MRNVKKVALLFSRGDAYTERLMRGIMDYAAEHRRWTFVLEAELRPPTLRGLAGWEGQGAIVILGNGNVQEARRLSIPLVNVSSQLQESPVPRVRLDDQAVGAMAAQHLMARGLTRFAYYGIERAWFSAERGKGFAAAIEAAGHSCVSHVALAGVRGRDRRHAEWKRLEAWLRTIQPPFGLLACFDQWAAAAMDACREIGLKVPSDVAVVGVNNDEITCEYSRPKLSSVIRPDYHCGYRAAALLDLLMDGKRPPCSEEMFPPIGVEQRDSTNMLSVANATVAEAARFIRDHVGEGIGVQDVLDHVSASRRQLEYAFRKYLGRTPYEYLRDMRVERARHLLLSQPKMRLKELSQACGFHDLQRLRLVFERLTGQSPRAYRRQALHISSPPARARNRAPRG